MSERLTKKDIENIKKLDVLSYFKNYNPEELIRMGRNDSYCLKSHRSIKLSNGLWCWWANNRTGGRTALDYLIKVEGYDFKDACFYLRDLMNTLPPVMVIPKPRQRISFRAPMANQDDAMVRHYLIAERGLDQGLVDELLEKRLIYEEAGSHNAVFLGFDEQGFPAYAFKRGTVNDIKQEAFGSSKAYSFRLANRHSGDLHLFEGAIDLLSCISMRLIKNEDWRDAGYLSLGGVTTEEETPPALVNYLERCPDVKNIYTHFDTDLTGIKAAVNIKNLLEGIFNVEDRNFPYYKDENEHLQNMRKGNI